MPQLLHGVWVVAVLAITVGSVGITPAAPVPKELKAVPPLAETTWAVTNSLGNSFTFTFEKDGTLTYTTRDGTYRNGKWKQTDKSIYIEMNDKYAEHNGEINGDTIEGTASNVKGVTWTWKMTKVKPEKEK
jgi:hypothetical protein